MAFPIISPLSVRLGVVGAGTMGSGIALSALLSDLYVTLYEISPDTLKKGSEYIHLHLAKKDKAANLPRLKLTSNLTDLSRCNFIIEAIPEDLKLKQDLFSQLGQICPPPAVLASNTSTLAVTAIAAAAASPARVAGMHFFNPAPLLPLVEVVRAAQTSEATIKTVVEVSRLIGKTPVIVDDTPGFIVNRVARPFYGEALRLVGEGSATVEQVDTIMRLGGGFKMGPFQLMDLIGIDINLAAMQSMWVQTFGEPRYRPHFIQVRLVEQRTLGRKTGQGFYDYSNPQAETASSNPGRIKPSQPEGHAYLLPGVFAPGLAGLIEAAGYPLKTLPDTSFLDFTPPTGSLAVIGIGAKDGLKERLQRLESLIPTDTLILCSCIDITAAELAAEMQHPERLVGFDGLFFASGKAATLTASPFLNDAARSSAESFTANLGRQPVWVGDSPGLVLPRIVCMLANEAAFAAGEGVAEPEEIDQAMKLGVNYPHGPLEWARRLGIRSVVRILDHLHAEYGEERYRVAPLLRRWARLEGKGQTN